MKKLVLRWLVFVAALSWTVGVWAQDHSDTLQMQLKNMEQRLTALEQQKPASGTGSGFPVFTAVEHNYLDFLDNNGNVFLKLGGVVQGDYRYYFGPSSQYFDPTGKDTFLIRKVRLDLVGYFDKNFGLRYQAEFAATGYAIQDAYVFIKTEPALQFQLGKFKTPV